MHGDIDDTGEIPILTDAVVIDDPQSPAARAGSLQSAIVSEMLELADSLLHRAAKDIEATLFENVLDRLREQLPEIVERVLRAQSADHGDGAGDD